MKILMLGWELPPYHLGGMGIACYQLCKALARRDVDIEFILPYSAEHKIDFMAVKAASDLPPDVARALGGIYGSQHFSGQIPKDFPNVADPRTDYTEGVLKLVEEQEFDVIHAHDWLTFRAAAAAKLHLGIPMIAHVHATEYDRAGGQPGNPMVREIEYYGLRLADKIVAVSEATKATIVREYDINPDNIQVVHNNFEINLNERLELQNTYHYLEFMRGRGYKIVVNAGRKTVQKGLNFLLEAAKEVIEQEPKTLFVFVGGGELFNELLMLAANLGISKNVLLLGHVDGTGKVWRDIFKVGDLFVMPSVSEPFGIAALEAAAFGTPVLVSKQSGVAEALKNVLKVDFWDTQQMANKITACIRYDSLRSELKNNAGKEFNRLSWDESAQQLMDIYEQRLVGAAA